MTDLQTVWRDLNHPPQDHGCVRCGRTVNDDEFDVAGVRVSLEPSQVMWRCAGCNGLVCRHCTLTKPGWRRPTEPHGPSGWDAEPSAGGREYLWNTLCSKICWARVGSPEE